MAPLPDGERALALSGVTKSFGDRTVVDAVSLELAAGEILSLVGESGCGKSTLLRLIAGLDALDAGAIEIGGRRVSGPGAFVEPERRDVGFIFQDYALFPHLTVAQNIRFGLRGRPRAEQDAIAGEMLERVGLAGFGGRYPHMLSGGEQQRVALARALAPKPAAVMMDEPFSNLDRRLGDRVRLRTLALLRDLGAAAILVTHDPEEAMASGDRVALMRRGAIVQIGSGEDLYGRPASREAADFFCAANALPGRRCGDAVETPIGRFPALPALAEGEAATVYVRARSVRLAEAGTGVPARVVSRSFLGHAHELALLVDGLETLVRAHTETGATAKVGDVIHICVSPSDGMVFPGAAPRGDLSG